MVKKSNGNGMPAGEVAADPEAAAKVQAEAEAAAMKELVEATVDDIVADFEGFAAGYPGVIGAAYSPTVRDGWHGIDSGLEPGIYDAPGRDWSVRIGEGGAVVEFVKAVRQPDTMTTG